MSTSTIASVPLRQSERTHRLLRAGVVAGPFFVLASLVQMPFRDGFDLTKHAFSFLLIGPSGWIQAIVFVVAGLLYGLAGRGLLHAVGGRAGKVALVAALGLGVGKVIAGVNAPQPSFGYPAGTPDGPPTVLTTASILHGVGFGVAVLCWTVLLVTLGVVLRRRGARSTSWLTFLAAVLLPVVPATSGTSVATPLLYVVVTAAYAVTSVAVHGIAARAAR
ncbi:DUF998 domain-containing protein [Intrasporangium sp.]|uniref:DUF998 domain-containing protein n=1 Tax=Intrasporangium sp. TaxID=1925024 RepID=UPI00293AF6EA|nr:DUF998 domain-containing protein [Intrasporangium sp.]MDV3220935.1 DUF998 domain-containing protein [Intrasporangium sp.]